MREGDELKTKIIVNPRAGRGNTRRSLTLLKKKLKKENIECSFILSRYPGHVEELAREAMKEGYQRIVACGGDGTVNGIINAIAGSDIVLGVIPQGTGNDYAMNLGIGSKPDSWCNILKRGEIKDVDLVKVNGVRYFGGVGGVGFDSEVVALADHYRKILPLTIRYSLAVLLRITTFKFKEIQLSWDGGDFRGEILLIAFGNTQSYGRGMEITPGAQVDDGLLDVCLIKKMGKLRLVSLFPTVYKGGHIKIPGVKLFRTKQVLLKSKIPLKLFGDGEFISQTPLSLQIVPRILKVMVSS